MVGNMTVTVITVLSRQGPERHDDSAPEIRRAPACAEGVRGKNQDLGLSIRWKIIAHMGCFQWRRMLVCLVTRKAKEGATTLLYRGKGGAIGFGRGWCTREEEEGVAHMPLGFVSPLVQTWAS
jgi:hypothetical protein